MTAARVVRVLDPFASSAATVVAQEIASLQRLSRNKVSLGLSGGRTPGPILSLLAQPPLSGAIDWGRVDFFWADERCVPPEHADSNFAVARRSLLDAVGADATTVHRIEGELGAPQASALYEKTLRRLVPDGLDLLLLGLGEDGHTASLFPGSTALRERDAFAVPAVSPSGQPRVTLTLPFIARCRRVIMLASGANKAKAAVEALEVGASSPAGLAAARESLLWLLDPDAGAELRRV